MYVFRSDASPTVSARLTTTTSRTAPVRNSDPARAPMARVLLAWLPALLLFSARAPVVIASTVRLASSVASEKSITPRSSAGVVVAVSVSAEQ